jgi:hypothetical protein
MKQNAGSGERYGGCAEARHIGPKLPSQNQPSLQSKGLIFDSNARCVTPWSSGQCILPFPK